MSQSRSQSRKTHTKSRLGCSACKQRHQKCDESRPSCVNCVTARRHCPYLDQQSDSEDSPLHNGIPVTDASTSRSSRQHIPSQQPIQLVLRDAPESLLYIELLEQWLAHTYSTSVGPKDAADKFGPIVLNHALNSPFLMHSMLSLAALHKASQADPTDRPKYLAASERLQAEGLTRFNVIVSSLSSDTIVPAFLFAFLTGIHRLCDASLQSDSPEYFITALIDAMVYLQGVNIIISGWWPLLKSSELAVLMPEADVAITAGVMPNQTEEFARLRQMVEAATADREASETYTTVVDGLQGLFDQVTRASLSENDESIGVVVVWMIAMPTQFSAYLKQRQPEALVILAYAAPLFHYKRSLWCIGDAGKVLMDAISLHLPDSLQHWLQWPKRMVGTK